MQTAIRARDTHYSLPLASPPEAPPLPLPEAAKSALRLVDSEAASVGRLTGPKRRVEHMRSEKSAASGIMTYLRDVRRHSVMSRAEEHDIAVRYVETGDERLAAQLVNANLRLVLKIALEYRVARRSLTDLIQEGNLGLIHAVQKYDPHRNVKLATYAAWWIRAYMLKYMLANARLVKIGTTRAQRKLFFGLRKARARLEGTSGAEVGTSQLAASMSVPESEVVEMQKRLAASDASLDWQSHAGDDRVRMECMRAETPGPDAELERGELCEALKRELAAFGQTLSGREAQIFHQRLLCEEPMTLIEFAHEFGVSRERVRQVESRLKARLREHLRAKLGDAVSEAAA